MHIIKQYCQKNKIKVKELAAATGEKPRRLYQIICGYRSCPPELAERIEKESGGKIRKEALVFPILPKDAA